MDTKRWLVIATMALLTAPSAAAVWSSHGSSEPDYPPDVANRWMWADPDWDPSPTVKKVYFNVFHSVYPTGVNPNAGASESRVAPGPVFEHPQAFLGVWKDCNKDSYIGLAEAAITAYRSELLTDLSVCPVGGEHNKGGWVYEFFWIGPGDNAASEPQQVNRFINDTGARVWGDTGLPQGGQSVGCFINPQRGAFDSTGGMVAYADCNGNRGVVNCYNALLLGDAWEPCVGAGTSPGRTPGLDESNSQGLVFSNPTFPQCGSGPKVETNLFGDDPNCPDGDTGLLQSESGDAAFGVWDCRSQTVITSDETGDVAYVPGLGPSVGSPTGSYWDGANDTVEPVQIGCDRVHEDPNGEAGDLGDAYEGVNPEDDVSAAGAQRDSTYVFEFGGRFRSYNDERGINCDGYVAEFVNNPGPAINARDRCQPQSAAQRMVPAAVGNVTGDDTPEWFGLFLAQSGQSVDAIWSADILQADPNSPPTLEVRDDLSGVDGAGPLYHTFYAKLSAQSLGTGLALPGGGATGTYLAEVCGTDRASVIDGIDCNPNNWYDQTKGAREEPTELFSGRKIGSRIGDAYHLRDTECRDGTLHGAAPGVGLGLTLLDSDVGGGPCA